MDLIRVNKTIPNESPKPKFLNNSLVQGPQRDNYKVYNKNVEFNVQSYGYIETFFLEMDLTPSAPATFPIPTSPYVPEHVFLTSRGNVIARNTTTYIISRLNSLQGTQLFDQMTSAMTIQGTFNQLKTISLPLFFYTNDGQLLDPNKYPDLRIQVIGKGTRQEMGMSTDLSALEFRLKTNYITYDIYRPIELKNSYNIHQDHPLTLLSGSSQAKLNLNVPYPVVNLQFMIRKTSNSANKGFITSVELKFNNGESKTYDNRTNFSLTASNSGNDGSSFEIPFGDRFNRDQFLQLSGNMNPVKVTVNYTLADPVEYQLFTCLEYLSDIVDNKGVLFERVEGSFN